MCRISGTAGARICRIDIKCVAREYYACALLQWTGGTFLNRTMRAYSNNLGWDLGELGMHPMAMKDAFTVGPTRHVDVKGLRGLHTEYDVFAFLGLQFIPPEQRDCIGLRCCYDVE